jgi:hypothetical protein
MEETAFRLNRYYHLELVEEAVKKAVDFARFYDGKRPLLQPDPTDQLVSLVSKIFKQTLAKYPEAFFTFGIGQNPEFWQMDLYTREPSIMAILELVEDTVLDEEDRSEIHFCVIPLRPQDWED